MVGVVDRIQINFGVLDCFVYTKCR